MERKGDPYEARARELCRADGLDPDVRIVKRGTAKTMPAWCDYRQKARDEANLLEAKAAAPKEQDPKFANAPLTVFGSHDGATIEQMQNCMKVGNVLAATLCADGHLGYAQPVGGVIAYENQISISGVGFDIACGNMAIKLDQSFSTIAPSIHHIAREIARTISFGIGRTNEEKVDHELFDDEEAWKASGMQNFKSKARAQLGTVGSGNHYVDLMYDEAGYVWIGVHFGSRGLGHTAATKYLKAAGGKDGIMVPPTVVDVDSDLGEQYLAAMHLAGRYAYAGREWVVERVRQIVGGEVLDSVHNHHNFAWKEAQYIGSEWRDCWVVRKGATPAADGQRGFVGGSMGDDAVILEGTANWDNVHGLMSTVHGAGRLFGRKEAKRRFSQEEMRLWLHTRGVTVMGGGLDESPMAYRRLPDVLEAHRGTINVVHTLRPFVVVMAGDGETDPYKD